jgi:hypothetical protein
MIYERMKREGFCSLNIKPIAENIILLFYALKKQNIFSQSYILKSLSDILLSKNPDF